MAGSRIYDIPRAVIMVPMAKLGTTIFTVRRLRGRATCPMGLVQSGLSVPFVGLVEWVQGMVMEVAQKLSQLGLPRSRGNLLFLYKKYRYADTVQLPPRSDFGPVLASILNIER